MDVESSRGLSGRVAVVTGAGGGIGAVIAATLARAGACLALVGRTPSTLAATASALGSGRDTPEDSLVVPADVTDERQVGEVIQTVRERWKRIDIVVNAAGLNVRRRALSEVSLDDWRAINEVNLVGPLLMAREALPVMRSQTAGDIVNISSTAGLAATLLSGPAYSASKAALGSLTASINLAERRHGIRAILVCPGDVSTPLLDRWPDPPGAQDRERMLQPQDVADVVAAALTLPVRALLEVAVLRPTWQP